jgi:hypothetical protein
LRQEGSGRAQVFERAVCSRRLDALGPPTEDHPEALLLAQREARPRTALRSLFEADAATDGDRQPLAPRSTGHHAMIRQLDRSLAPSVVEARIEDGLHLDRAFSSLQEAVQLVCRGARIVAPRHEIGQAHHSLAGSSEESLENVGGVVVGLKARVTLG